MKPGSWSGVGIPESTLDLSFGFNDPNFSDRLLLIETIGDDDRNHRLANQNLRRSKNLKRRCPDDHLNNADLSPSLKTLHINSLILAARSPFFHKLFSNGMQETEQKHATLRIEAFEEASFMKLLKYVYSNILPTALNALLDKFEVASCSMDCTRELWLSANCCQDIPSFRHNFCLTDFVDNGTSHFINDILHVRAVLTIKKLSIQYLKDRN